MLYLFHGEDDFRRQEAVTQLKTPYADPTIASLNVTLLDGRTLTLEGLLQAGDAMPFMADRRLVIVTGFLGRFEERRRASVSESSEAASGEPDSPAPAGHEMPNFDRFRDYVTTLPPTTDLVFVEETSISKGNPFYGLILKQGKVEEFTPLRGDSLSTWVVQRLRRAGGKVTGEGVEALVAAVGSNLRLMVQEIDKLVTYAGPDQPITANLVRLLVPDTQGISVFKLTDAIGTRDGRQSLICLHELLDEGAAPPYILVMITRQFRLLIQARELLDGGASATALGSALHLASWQVGRIVAQANHFTLPKLEQIYRRLAMTDLAAKTGNLAPELALELLVLDLAGGLAG